MATKGYQKNGPFDHIDLTSYQMFCWKVTGKTSGSRYKPDPKLEQQLLMAHIRMRPEEFLSYVWTTCILVFLVMIFVASVLSLAILSSAHSSVAFVLVIFLIIAIMPTITAYIVLMSGPSSKANARARDINKRLGPAMNFISALASADVNVDVIFRELAKQDIYGEIKSEAEWISRDTELLGMDILTAIKRAAQRTPSTKFQDFLQGVVTTSTSGGQLKPYFIQKAEQYQKENKLEMRSQLESLGLIAESFVTVVVAFPLFLVIILAIMAIIPGSGGNTAMTVSLLELVIMFMLPLSQSAFIFYVWNMTKESSF